MERRAAMLNHETLCEETRLEALEERLRSARTLTPDLVSDVIAEACPRLAALGTKAEAAVWGMIEAGALSGAMLALVEIALPQWKPRRLVCAAATGSVPAVRSAEIYAVCCDNYV